MKKKICHELLLGMVSPSNIFHTHWLMTYWRKYGNICYFWANIDEIPLHPKQAF